MKFNDINVSGISLDGKDVKLVALNDRYVFLDKNKLENDYRSYGSAEINSNDTYYVRQINNPFWQCELTGSFNISTLKGSKIEANIGLGKDVNNNVITGAISLEPKIRTDSSNKLGYVSLNLNITCQNGGNTSTISKSCEVSTYTGTTFTLVARISFNSSLSALDMSFTADIGSQRIEQSLEHRIDGLSTSTRVNRASIKFTKPSQYDNSSYCNLKCVY